MINIDKIIDENIEKYINENVINENSFVENSFIESEKNSKSEKARKKNHAVKKNVKKINNIKKLAKKLKNGLRTDFDSYLDKLTNPNLNDYDNKELADLVDNPLINQAGVAKKMYPHHTPQGAQSQLRKKVKGLKSDSGSTYKLKKKEANRLLSILSNELL